MVSIGRVTFVVIILAGLAGCATMNKSECLNAAKSKQAQLNKLKKGIKAQEALLVSSKPSENHPRGRVSLHQERGELFRDKSN
jgi:hypothetical protein